MKTSAARGRRLGHLLLALAILTGISTSARPEVAEAKTAPPATKLAPPAAPTTDTTYTHIQATVDSQAAWANFNLTGVQVMASRVVSVTTGMQVVDFGGTSVGLLGRGQAVVELVLKISPGATPAMRFCKNYLGPATVTIRRITAAPVVVASVTNTSTSYAIAAGGCEGQLDLALSRADLMGSQRWPARRDSRALVLAAYHPWFDERNGPLSQVFGDQPTGPVGTHDPATVAAAVDLAANAGINAFLIDYAGTRDDLATGLVYDAADRRGGFQVAPMLDLDILNYLHGRIDRPVIETAARAAAAHASRPSQLRIGNQPVLFVYGAHLVDPVEWRAAMSRLPKSYRPFVIADDAALSAPGLFRYNTYDAPLMQWSHDALQQYRLQPEINGSTAPLWVAPVMPGYDDQLLRRTVSLAIARESGARFDEAWAASLRTLPEWVLVTSWNEYYEQTHVMPGTTTGTLALDQITTWSGAFRRTG